MVFRLAIPCPVTFITFTQRRDAFLPGPWCILMVVDAARRHAPRWEHKEMSVVRLTGRVAASTVDAAGPAENIAGTPSRRAAS